MKRIVSVFMAALMAAFMFCFAVVPVSAADSLDIGVINWKTSTSSTAYDKFINDFDHMHDDDMLIAFNDFVKRNNFTRRYIPVAYTSTLDRIYYIDSLYNCTLNCSYSGNYNWLAIADTPIYYYYLVDGKTYSWSGSSITFSFYNGSGANVVFDFVDFYNDPSFPDSYIIPTFNYDNNYLGLGIDVADFLHWYDTTDDKYKNQLASNLVPSFNIKDNNLKYLLDYFNNYGNKFDLFYVARDKISLCYRYPDRPPSEAEFHLLFDMLHDHYLDYKRYKSMFLPDVVPNVSVDDTLITDIDVDTIDISLLREILRTLIITYNSVNDVDLNLSSYILNMYLKIDSFISDIDANFTALRSDLSFHFDSLADKIGISVANNINPSLKSIDNSVNALAVPLTDIDADLNANLEVANNIDANLEANLQAVNNIDGSVNNLDVSLKEINNSVSGGSGGCCSGSGSGSSPEAPEVPEFDFDTLKDGMGNFLDFFVWVCDHLPPSITVLMGAALSVAIYCRICAR